MSATAPPLTGDELAQLAAAGVDPSTVAILELGVAQVQVLGHGQDQTGAPIHAFGFMAAIPAGLLRPRREIFGPDGQIIGGGLPEAMPIAPKVRIVVRLDALAEGYREQLAPTLPVLREYAPPLALPLAGGGALPAKTARRRAKKARRRVKKAQNRQDYK